MTDPYDLQRFVDAQAGGTYERALAELRAGRKTSHWMWFVFPQVAGLGRSEMAVRYAISGLDEAQAYGTHPLLDQRYVECCEALVDLGDVQMADVLGDVDAQKLRSSLTLFAEASPSPQAEALLDRHFSGERDPATLRLL
ncbi:DUF1810 domain-containing protein [Aeromicrobium sp. 9AM]|uniref:DUF1810 domain-containing protein n=1 Tax=Aeromicrobium sp. 9AM TaxID=2653126 RepID=UPI0012EF6791|nr:DUF1810 domain-containing protein [Aeromicrobium sp. 9AM]VXB10624.1 Calpastatin [Aeromicrobium sp. 9AM]